MARPKAVINYDIVKTLAEAFCTQEEIATHLGVSTRTLQRDETFCRIYKEGIANVKISLRRMQLASAKKGNVTMQLWLGKQYLGQKDRLETNDISNRELLEQLSDKGKDYK